MKKIINFITGVCILWVLLIGFTFAVSLIGSIITGWTEYIKMFMVVNFFGTLLLSFLLELYFNQFSEEGRQDGREERREEA